MKSDVDVRLIHDGVNWVVDNETLTAQGATFDELDESLKQALIQSGDFPPTSEVTVFMGFDFDTIPTRLRQYHSHYFNRTVALTL